MKTCNGRGAAMLGRLVLLCAIILAAGCTPEKQTEPGVGLDAPSIPAGDHRYDIYTVREGDTLHSIGQRMGVPWKRIQEVNNCDPRDLSEGQVLLIPLHAKEGDGGAEERSPTLTQRGGRGTGMVVIDPGHGGRDPGAISPIGLREKKVNLAVARQVARILEREGCRVTMTRRGDAFVTLEQRASMANRLNADLFVSIHSNSSRDSGASGYEVYVAEQGASSTSRRAARSVVNSLSGVGIPSRGVKTAGYHVLVNTRVPAILVEMGFLSNSAEARKLQDAATQDRLARRIADGILSAL